MSSMDGVANIAAFVETSQRVSLWLDHFSGILECGEMLGCHCRV